MEIKNLTTFIHVAEALSFTKAAENLGYTQSTVSFQIKQLETELQCSLFDRINHNVVLTTEGKKLLAFAHQITSQIEMFQQDFYQPVAPEGTINIVTSDSVCQELLSAHYPEFRQRYPYISLQFYTANTDEMINKLDRNEADVILTLDYHIYKNDYVIVAESPVNIQFVVNSDSPLAKKKNLTIEDIINEKFILTEKGMSYRNLFEQQLAKLSLTVEPVLETGRTDVILQCILNSDEIALLPDFVVEDYVKQGKLTVLEIKDFNIVIWKQLIHHKNKWISNALESFIGFVKEIEFNQKG